MTSHISHHSGTSSLMDRARVRGVRSGRKNKKRGSRTVSFAGIKTIVIGAIGIALLATASFYLHRFATTSPRFAVDDIVVTGHSRATAESIAKLSGANPGENIFSLDGERMKRTIEAHPWVESAKVSKSYPRTVEVEVIEHVPRVLVALGHLYYANGDGEIVKRYAPGEKEKLPVVTGLSREQIETDDGQAKAQLRSAIDFLDQVKSMYGAGSPNIASMNLDAAAGLSFVEADEQLTVVMGHPPFDRALSRLGRVKAALKERKVEATRIVLGFERRRDRAVASLVTVREGE